MKITKIIARSDQLGMSKRGPHSVPSASSPQPEYYWDASESLNALSSIEEESENESNHDDIDERTRRFHFLDTSVCLYQAALKGDWSAAKEVLDKYPKAATYSITRQKDTVLHIAAAAESTDFVKELVKRMNPSDLEIKNRSNNTAICYAAASGIVAIAEEMVNKNNQLPQIRVSIESVTPLYMAALHGRRNMVSYLYSVTPFEDLTPPERIDILVVCISTDLYDIALKILKRDPELATMKNAYGKIALQELAKKPDAIGSRSQLSIWERCLNFWPFKGIYNKALMRAIAHQLVDLLWVNVRQLPEKDFSDMVQNHSSFLFDAAISGNVEFLIILIRSYPDLIWSLDEKKRSIFHFAIIYRQESVFSLIYELGAIKGIIALYTDNHHNNMLHLAAEIAPPDRLNIISGAALKLQRELLWFKEIEKIVQPSYRKKKNIDENNKTLYTPWELFTKTHKNLQKQGEKWMKDTANYGMLVATLIATVVFAAAFTVPGGNHQEQGTPILLSGKWFMAFFISDAIALVSSSTSILTFLSILTSRYAEKDFLYSLPARLLLGLATLFISIASMVIAFSATCFLVYDSEITSVPIIITSLAAIPVTLFLTLHYRLWLDIFRSTYVYRFLFRPHERRVF
ncbi:ankyrin repeat-containing protein ITN1-like [Carya illinoinensis]|uniref:ankyrin repeat-containing protein ITN1-like n=1 Tax=Carya illinoinensis TaxID=32201 RepID=UPI001C7285F0|nr:ankyrin repeat-containing protein ITN1-like [Carya illinoinensis]